MELITLYARGTVEERMLAARAAAPPSSQPTSDEDEDEGAALAVLGGGRGTSTTFGAAFARTLMGGEPDGNPSGTGDAIDED